MNYDPHVEGRTALRESRSTSLIEAFKVLGGYLAVCVAFGGALIALQRFNTSILAGMALGSIAALASGYAFWEFRRLARCRDALDEIVREERSFEDLLRDARGERDRAVQERNTLQAQMAVQFEAFASLRAARESPVLGARRQDDRSEPPEPEDTQTPARKRPR